MAFGGPLGPFEGAGSAEAEIESLLCQSERIIGTAGIAVHDALGLIAFQQSVDVGVGVAVMHDDGLVQLQRQPDLGLKQGQLGVLGTGQ